MSNQHAIDALEEAKIKIEKAWILNDDRTGFIKHIRRDIIDALNALGCNYSYEFDALNPGEFYHDFLKFHGIPLDRRNPSDACKNARLFK